MLLIPEAAGPQSPVRRTPARQPRSVRRTTNIDTARPDGLGGGLVITARARDLRTDAAGTAAVIGDAELHARASGAGGSLLELSTRPRMELGALIGAIVGPGFRARIGAADGPEPGSLLFTLLDDLPGAVLVSGYAVQRAGGFEAVGSSALPEEMASKARATMALMGDDRCAGWAHDATMMVTVRERGVMPVSQGPPAPRLEDPGDPDGWHEMDAMPPHGMRRRRRLDVVSPAEPDDPYRIDVHFRDSHVGADGEECVLHEYTVSGAVDRRGERVLEVSAEARVLPWIECPGAVDSAHRIGGMAVGDLRGRVRRELVGVSTCTHLNDTLRSLDDVSALIALFAPGRDA